MVNFYIFQKKKKKKKKQYIPKFLKKEQQWAIFAVKAVDRQSERDKQTTKRTTVREISSHTDKQNGKRESCPKAKLTVLAWIQIEL